MEFIKVQQEIWDIETVSCLFDHAYSPGDFKRFLHRQHIYLQPSEEARRIRKAIRQKIRAKAEKAAIVRRAQRAYQCYERKYRLELMGLNVGAMRFISTGKAPDVKKAATKRHVLDFAQPSHRFVILFDADGKIVGASREPMPARHGGSQYDHYEV